MQQMLQKLVNTLEGRWTSQKTIYDFTNKKIDTHNSIVNISLIKFTNISVNLAYVCKYENSNKKKITYNYIAQNKQLPIIGKIEKADTSIVTEYMFQLQDKNNLKIQYHDKNILYTEYIYFIQENFKLSFVIIKKEQKYIAIGFISDIKIIKK
uniref:Chromophore lyase cpcS/cpeS n=1 Tax=Eucheuma denticulatum TaxID=305493 RepID=A0A8E7UF66_9FLOR|nr:hypothetical protein [Eucheuma denticulatum]